MNGSLLTHNSAVWEGQDLNMGPKSSKYLFCCCCFSEGRRDGEGRKEEWSQNDGIDLSRVEPSLLRHPH